MISRVTISLEPEIKKKLHVLAKRKQRTVSRFINELISEEANKEQITISKAGLGTHLANLSLTDLPKNFKSDKEIVSLLKEEKHLRKK